jgi:hypothetical protein
VKAQAIVALIIAAVFSASVSVWESHRAEKLEDSRYRLAVKYCGMVAQLNVKIEAIYENFDNNGDVMCSVQFSHWTEKDGTVVTEGRDFK